ncbi:hypothetical protein Syun_007682 [Stephania yunnanensis]|uniref:Uncharacterized protein n=1 Tax=Stephania yunnanensis TaxID=152371 RepID=A0AAP0KZ57_9MAGN
MTNKCFVHDKMEIKFNMFRPSMVDKISSKGLSPNVITLDNKRGRNTDMQLLKK